MYWSSDMASRITIKMNSIIISKIIGGELNVLYQVFWFSSRIGRKYVAHWLLAGRVGEDTWQ